MTWTHTANAQRVVFGEGAIDSIARLLKDIGGRRAMVVTSQARAASEAGQRLARILGRAAVTTFADARAHVPASALQAAMRQARSEGIDAVVSFGGGSAIELAKGVTYFHEHESGTPGVSFIDRPVLPHIAVPTTYSPAACTAQFSVTDERTRTKSGAGSTTSAPIAVVYDPDLLIQLPLDVSVQSALGALAQCLEVMWAAERSPEAEALAASGASRLSGALGALVDSPADANVRGALLTGAAMASRAAQNASAGALTGLAQLLGGRTGIAHGVAVAVLAAKVMAFNAEVAPAEVTQFGSAIGDRDDPAGALERLIGQVGQVGLPSTLDAAGVAIEDIEAVSRMSQASPMVQRNPRRMTEDDARSLLESVW